MSDEQQGGMEPEAAVRRNFTEDTVPGPEPADDTEGHGRSRFTASAKDDEELGSETGTEAEGIIRPGRYGDGADTEGQMVRGKGGVSEDEQPGADGPEVSDDEDTEAHRQSLYSDRSLKRDITPVSW